MIKDAGDDPDVTHGARIRVTVRRGDPGTGVMFIAGEGVGVVTRPGLPIPVGEPAINPAPRQLIRELVAEIAQRSGRRRRPRGDASRSRAARSLAKRTANGRLGIVGGLSILGTTGIVDAVFLLGLDPLDPPRHRRRPRLPASTMSPPPPARPRSAPSRRSTACRRWR